MALVTSGPAAWATCTPAGNFVCSAPSKAAVPAVAFSRARRLSPWRDFVIPVVVISSWSSRNGDAVPCSPLAPLLAVDPIKKPPPALESVCPQGGGVACPVRNRPCVAVSADGGARHLLYKLRANSRRRDKSSPYQADSASAGARCRACGRAELPASGPCCKNFVQRKIQTCSGAPDRPGRKVGGDGVGIESRSGECPDPVVRLARHTRLRAGDRRVVKVGAKDCLGGGQEFGR